jgi:hypothetical protein
VGILAICRGQPCDALLKSCKSEGVLHPPKKQATQLPRCVAPTFFFEEHNLGL